jgi:hypothetical protein
MGCLFGGRPRFFGEFSFIASSRFKKSGREPRAVATPHREYFSPAPPSSPHSLGTGAHGLRRMVAAAKAHAVGEVELGTTISDFHDVVGEHAMPRLGLGAAPPIVDSLASALCIADHCLTPCPMLLREIERLDCMGLWPDGTCIYGAADERR